MRVGVHGVGRAELFPQRAGQDTVLCLGSTGAETAPGQLQQPGDGAAREGEGSKRRAALRIARDHRPLSQSAKRLTEIRFRISLPEKSPPLSQQVGDAPGDTLGLQHASGADSQQQPARLPPVVRARGYHDSLSDRKGTTRPYQAVGKSADWRGPSQTQIR